jgi:hypothetical protein
MPGSEYVMASFLFIHLYKKVTDYIIIMENWVEKDFTTIGKRAHWLLRSGDYC